MSDNEATIIVCGGGKIDESAVSVWNDDIGRNVCGLCGCYDLSPGYGLAGGGGIGGYNFCNGCQRILDKSEDVS